MSNQDCDVLQNSKPEVRVRPPKENGKGVGKFKKIAVGAGCRNSVLGILPHVSSKAVARIAALRETLSSSRKSCVGLIEVAFSIAGSNRF
jgi:hypothetical protein